MTETKRSLGVVSATLLVVGNVLGVGIFYTVGSVQELSGGSQGSLVAWGLGGLLAVLGGLVSAECATRFPQNGGDYLYLSEAFGRPVGFLSGWASFAVGFPGSIATLAAAFAMLFNPDSEMASLVIAVLVVWGVTLVALLPIRMGAMLNGAVTIGGLSLLLVVVINAPTSADSSTGVGQEWQWLGMGAALVPVYFSYSGWNVITYISGECARPSRTIPVALLSGIAVVCGVYMLFSQVIAPAVPPQDLNKGIGPVLSVMKSALGAGGELGVPAILLAGVCTTLLSTTLAGPRLTSEMAGRGDFFPFFARRSTRSGVPIVATLVQGTMASFLVLTGTFQDLLEWTTGVMLVFGACIGVAQIVLRVKDKRDPGAEHIFSDPLFPLSSILLVFLCLGVLTAAVARGQAWHLLAGLAVVLCGWPVHLFVRVKP